MRVNRSLCFKLFTVLAFFGLLLIGWREFELRRLPFDEVQIPHFESDEKLEIPPRPGIQGIVITGPAIELLYFSIDLSKGGIRTLDWRRLQNIDPHADVRVNCIVDNQGQLSFTQEDVLMEGHTEAGMMIQRALKTWTYTPFKRGIIRFWFNLPSKGKKLIIDTSSLYRREDIPEYVPIFDGQVHFIEGIRSDQIFLRAK